jgi:hypothetical protein
VISVIREFPRTSEVEVPPLVNTFLGKLRYGPVSTSLPFKSAFSLCEKRTARKQWTTQSYRTQTVPSGNSERV